ncbi:MAG: carboxy terminal-processing peptidase [Myxococcales bacterium]|nr:carboxy terminal-processing peptidase [Myxococcales bacterium]
MKRSTTLVIISLAALALSACSASKPTSKEAPRAAEPAVSVRGADEAPPPDPREKILSEAVLHLFQEQHLLRKRIDDEVSRAAFDNYLDRLDGGKMFLLRKDREALGRYADQVDDQLRAGTLTLAHEGSRAFVARVEVIDKLVAELLAKPVDLSNEEWVELDPKKLQPATTEDELRERWRQRIELEVLERITQMESALTAKAEVEKRTKAAQQKKAGSGTPSAAVTPPDAADEEEEPSAIPVAQIPTTAEAREAKARADLAKSYSGRFARLRTPAKLEVAADLVNAVGEALDPHTSYLPPADKANFDIRMSGSLQGIGAVLRERDHYVEVAELVPGGASWRHGGIAAGDLILSVVNTGQEPVDVLDMHIDDVVKIIRGPKGTVVTLRLQKATGVQETVSITRDVVVIEEAYARGAELTRKGKPSIGYINLPSFYGGQGSPRTASLDIRYLLGELRARKVRGVILDIRGNGGGLLNDAVRLTGELIDRGPVVQVRDGHGRSETLEDERPGINFDGPVIVLVDKFSASASEILAGALQDYQRAIIVGTGPTHGKGTVQTLADLDELTGGALELGVLKLTIQQFFRVSGASTQREGVTPDILLPDPAGHVESGERDLPHAIAWSKVAPQAHSAWGSTWNVPELAKRSQARVTKHPLLAKISAATAVLKARREDTRVPLTKAAFEARRKEQRKAIDEVSPDFKAVPAAFAVKMVSDRAAAPRPDGKADDSLKRWQDNLAHDPWVDECLSILGDVIR